MSSLLETCHAEAAEQRREIERLRALLGEARNHIGSMPTMDSKGDDHFLPTLRLVTKIERELGLQPPALSAGEIR